MQRRTFLLTSLLPALLASAAESSEIDPKQTFVLQRDGIRFAPWAGLPPGSGEMAKLYGDIDRPGPYLVPRKWNPGWFSAMATYCAFPAFFGWSYPHALVTRTWLKTRRYYPATLS